MFFSVKRAGSGLLRWVYGITLLFALGAAQAQSLSKMALLLPDGLAVSDVQVTAWTDAAQEQGYQLAILRNADFLLQGAGIRSQYSGIIVPDQMQVSMGDALVNTIQSYVTQGGNIMLVYDAGALTDTGFYPIPKSRFSDLVGVDYVLYDQLLDLTVGLGPVVGAVSTLRSILVPPGKSMPYTAPAAAASIAPASTALSTTAARGVAPAPVVSTAATAQFLPASPTNPGGLKGYNHSLYFKTEAGLTEASKTNSKKISRSGKVLVQATVINRPAVAKATAALKSLTSLTPVAAGTASRSLNTSATTLAAPAANEPIHSISGYVYGALTYPSFVTQGTSQGNVLLSSPVHGVVASTRNVGSGSVLFVNMPITYLKLSEDAMPLHGFLHLFASSVLKQPRLTNVPDGIGGMVFNWHLDSKGAQQPIQQLKNMGVWNYKPFSIHITAGPDTIVAGDKLGFDLPNNPTVKQHLRNFDAQGHQVGNHGGWIHDYYGNNANETNQAEFQNYLVLNRNAVQAAIGHGSTEYSAPQGNNPLWALNWLQQNGVIAYYSLSHTGTATTRTYRAGNLVNPGLWAVPVTPFGVAATFEEFEELAFAEADIIQWYKDLMDFSSNNETNRMIYAHPPGAVDYPNVMNTMLQYANTKQTAGQFRWYTMTRLATFMNQRAATTWQSAIATNGKMRVTASNTATNLTNLAWAYSKAQYSKPVKLSGSMTIVDQGNDWLVRITSGKTASFEATPL